MCRDTKAFGNASDRKYMVTSAVVAYFNAVSLGYSPAFWRLNQVLRETGIRAGIGGVAFGSPSISFNRYNLTDMVLLL
jgi:hypothetical protein